MKKILGKLFMMVAGWKVKIDLKTKNINHCVMIAAPHTSNWDFPFTLATFWMKGIDLKFFIKDSYTKSFYGFIFKWMGAIGVDREKKNNLVEHAVSLLKGSEKLVILIPPEGTRSKVDAWKKGFYHIANGANVPVALGYLDFKKKVAGVDRLVMPTSNIKTDFKAIEDVYLKYTGKNPENYNPLIFERE